MEGMSDMADTWQDEPRLRPQARPDAPASPASVEAARLRPRPRPDGHPPGPPPGEAAELADAGSGPARPRTRPEGLGTVPQETQEAATVAGALSLGETTLIGLFNGPEGGTALLRLPGGSFVKVGAGGSVAGGRVTAIDGDSLRLQRGDREIVLTMPG